MNKKLALVTILIGGLFFAGCSIILDSEDAFDISFIVTDTMQTSSYNNDGIETSAPDESSPLYGQDAQYTGIEPSFKDNGDGTVTDLNTGLMWQQTPDYEHYTFDNAKNYAEKLSTGGYNDWRLPTIKELYSIADFRGEIVNGSSDQSTPYIDTDYFDFEYTASTYIGQYWSSTVYTSGPLQDIEVEGAFGFNFADGHIKGYETGYYFNGSSGVNTAGNFVRCVRGTENVYGVNDFTDNGDGTVTDNATGLMWSSSDQGEDTLNWQEALQYAESSTLAGYEDWRLPNVKELQSIVDYDRSTWPAIDTDFFTLTGADTTSDAIWLWTSTTHGDSKNYACYVCFGRAWSKDDSTATVYYDWHGAGAQRSDPKSGSPSDYVSESENAADLVQIDNYVLIVRDK